MQPPKSKAAIHKAYRAAAKLWHPDRFEGNQKKRLEAEERFKRIHAAYQALCVHFENPTRELPEADFVSPIRRIPTPTIHFGGAPDCFVAPHFPARIREAIAGARVENSDPPVGFIDLSTGSARSSHFILLTGHRMYVRDPKGLLSVVWYSDLGDVDLVDSQAGKKPGAWQRIAETLAGKAQRYSLRICRLNGTLFRELTDRPDDRVKKVVYNFLRQMKSNWQS
ncbi:MAG: J domain-containing protein [Terracidiphilus sp.]